MTIPCLAQSQNLKPSTESDRALLKKLIEVTQEQQIQISQLEGIAASADSLIKAMELATASDQNLIVLLKAKVYQQENLSKALSREIDQLKLQKTTEVNILKVQNKVILEENKSLKSKAKSNKFWSKVEQVGLVLAAASVGYLIGNL